VVEAESSEPGAEWDVAPATSPRGGPAVVSVVLAGLALILALVALAVGASSASASDPGGGYGLRGIITPMNGRALTGPALAAEIVTTVSEDGGEPEGMTCPTTAKVAQDVTTVCHGSDYGASSTFVVFFEHDRGAYTLLEI